MHLIEIYKSVQGESSFAGMPCIFVRLAGCNLRCSWCDSEYTFTGGRKMSAEEVEAEVSRLGPHPSRILVEITGGEPMLQERELLPFIGQLLKRGYIVLMETSGERPLAAVPRQVHKIVDVKCPGSGEGGSFHLPNLESLTSRDEMKFVIASREDYEFARGFIREHALDTLVGHVLLSPAFQKLGRGRTADNMTLDPGHLVEWMLADGLQARLSLQIHKFVWEPQTKGV